MSRSAVEEVILYVLKLQHGKYYVGNTANDLDRRFAEHLDGRSGSKWTKRHPPIEVVHQQRGNGYMEDALVCQYMSKYGINNVRGGTFSDINLREDQRERIGLQLRHQGNTCFNCGSSDHFATSCPKISVGENQIQRDGNERSGKHGTRRRLKCTRCGRNSHHTEKDCFAFTDVDGDVIMRDVDDDAVDDRDHISIESDSRCARCGRDSHSQSNCYASTHIQGQRRPPSIIDLTGD